MAGLTASASICTARSLGLHDCRLTDLDEDMLDSVSRSTNLERLDVSGNAIGASAVVTLAKRLAQNDAALTYLDVRGAIPSDTDGNITMLYTAAKDAVAAGK